MDYGNRPPPSRAWFAQGSAVAALTLAAALTAPAPGAPPPSEPLSVWYARPAREWEEALPVGNGRLGAMVFGDPGVERLQFNQDTLWQGEPRSYARDGAHKFLEPIRQLLWAGKQKEAEAVAMQEFMSVPLRQMAYQAFADLLLLFPGLEISAVRHYRRDLNLDTAIAAVEFESEGVRYRREVVASFADQVIAIRLTASQPGKITCSAVLRPAHAGSRTATAGPDEIALSGGVPGGVIRFEARLLVHAGKAGFLHLLPALPSVWPDGRVTGLRARGGFDVDITWRGGKLAEARVFSRLGKPLKVRYAGREVGLATQAGRAYVLSGDLQVR